MPLTHPQWFVSKRPIDNSGFSDKIASGMEVQPPYFSMTLPPFSTSFVKCVDAIPRINLEHD
jgi:hypothetical protein